MCMGPELMLIASMAASAGGSYIEQKESQDNAAAVAAARNRELEKNIARQNELVAQSQAKFKENLDAINPEGVSKLNESQEQRTTVLEDAATQDTTGPTVSLSGSAPKVVNSEFAEKLSESLNKSKQTAGALGRFGGFGQQLFGNQLGIAQTGRGVETNSNFARSEAALLPHMQDYRAIEATKPSSGKGALLKGVGSALGSFAGGGAGFGSSIFGKAAALPAGPQFLPSQLY